MLFSDTHDDPDQELKIVQAFHQRRGRQHRVNFGGRVEEFGRVFRPAHRDVGCHRRNAPHFDLR